MADTASNGLPVDDKERSQALRLTSAKLPRWQPPAGDVRQTEQIEAHQRQLEQMQIQHDKAAQKQNERDLTAQKMMGYGNGNSGISKMEQMQLKRMQLEHKELEQMKREQLEHASAIRWMKDIDEAIAELIPQSNSTGIDWDWVRAQVLQRLGIDLNDVGAPDGIKVIRKAAAIKNAEMAEYTKIVEKVVAEAMAKQKEAAKAPRWETDPTLKPADAIAMLRLPGKTAKQKYGVMERIRKSAGDRLRCKFVGNAWVYHAGDWKKIVNSIRAAASSKRDDADGIDNFELPPNDEVEAMTAEIKAANIAGKRRRE